MAETVTDAGLLERASRGDASAFRQLYERHRDLIFRFAYRLSGSVELAEDITHDCFLSLMSQPGRFDPARASLRTYLYAAVRNLTLKHLRHRDAGMAIEELSDELRLSPAEGPLHKLLDEELSATVRRAIASLELLQREALILFEYEELTLAEVAAIVGADVGTVKARLHRARERLRKVLAPYFKNRLKTPAIKGC
jgi:RNA polymerase sigma-70 factor (ECF subfamily)